ncbi:tetratricopeptide repeat protein [Arenibacterium sp. CAU 1754]
MSDTDSFIEEVTEEVRRDQLFKMFKRYGWIAGLLIVLIVGGAAWNEYNKSRERAASQDLGDQLLAALEKNEPADRAAELATLSAETPGGNAVIEFTLAAAQAEAGDIDAAVAALNNIASNGELPEIYRQIAAFKALTLQADTLPAADLRLQFEALAQPGAPLRLLAEEQLALVAVSEGQAEAAIDRFQAILQDAEASMDLKQRAAQAIVALGGEPQPQPGNTNG